MIETTSGSMHRLKDDTKCMSVRTDSANSGFVQMVNSCENGNEFLRCVKGGEFLDLLKSYELLKKDSNPWGIKSHFLSPSLLGSERKNLRYAIRPNTNVLHIFSRYTGYLNSIT
jgi:hypothetical protein